MKKDQGSTNHEYENEITLLYLTRLIMVSIISQACTVMPYSLYLEYNKYVYQVIVLYVTY